ncbi:MAG: hypothetical protein ACLPKB_06725 [Xanthobacteraceae bacterium]
MPRGGARPGAGRKRGGLDRPAKELRSAAAKHGFKLVEALAKLALDKNTPPASIVSAANAVLDRGFGKPAQEVRHSGAVGNYNLEALPSDELHALAAILRKASDGHGDTD